jgi:hypothetical protein
MANKCPEREKYCEPCAKYGHSTENCHKLKDGIKTCGNCWQQGHNRQNCIFIVVTKPDYQDSGRNHPVVIGEIFTDPRNEKAVKIYHF